MAIEAPPEATPSAVELRRSLSTMTRARALSKADEKHVAWHAANVAWHARGKAALRDPHHNVAIVQAACVVAALGSVKRVRIDPFADDGVREYFIRVQRRRGQSDARARAAWNAAEAGACDARADASAPVAAAPSTTVAPSAPVPLAAPALGALLLDDGAPPVSLALPVLDEADRRVALAALLDEPVNDSLKEPQTQPPPAPVGLLALLYDDEPRSFAPVVPVLDDDDLGELLPLR